MSHTQDQQMRSILLQLEVISNGTIASYNSAGGGHGDNPDPRPKGASGCEYLYWRNQYGPPFSASNHGSATTDQGRDKVIHDANAELNRLRGGNGGVDRSHVTGETNEQFEARLIKHGQGFTPDEVANQFHCTPTRVRRIRTANSRHPDTGKPIVGTDHGTDDKAIEARRLKTNGMSVRAIALTLHTQPTQIQRWLTRKAA